MSGALSYHPDRYEIPLFANSVSRLYLSSGCDLHIGGDEEETAIRIAGPIAVVTETCRPLAALPDIEAPRSFGRIIVSRNALCEERQLDITFDDGVTFWVEPNATRSEWGPAGSKGLIVVCMAGGELAVWFGVRRARTQCATESIVLRSKMPVQRLELPLSSECSAADV